MVKSITYFLVILIIYFFCLLQSFQWRVWVWGNLYSCGLVKIVLLNNNPRCCKSFFDFLIFRLHWFWTAWRFICNQNEFIVFRNILPSDQIKFHINQGTRKRSLVQTKPLCSGTCADSYDIHSQKMTSKNIEATTI